MTKTKSKQNKNTAKRKAYIALALILGSLAILAGIGSGALQYSLSTVECLKAPVAASRFMAGYTYHLPGDAEYGPSPFNEYYCSEQAAIQAGFHRL